MEAFRQSTMNYEDVAVPNPQGWENVADAIFRNARRRPTHAAIIDGERTITYADLADLVFKTAGHLQDCGIKSGDLVGNALGDNADHLITHLSIAWLGAVILPMDLRWTTEEKRRIATHFGAKLVIVQPGEPAITGVNTIAADTVWHSSIAAHSGQCDFVRRRDQPLLLSLSSGTTGEPKGPWSPMATR